MQQYNLNKVIGVVEVEPNVVKCDLTVVNFETYLTPYEKDDFGVWRLLSRKVSTDTGWQFLSLSKDMTEEMAKQLGFVLDLNKKCSCCPECGNKLYTNKNLVGDGFRQCDDKSCFQEWWIDIYYDKSKFMDAHLKKFREWELSEGLVTVNPYGKVHPEFDSTSPEFDEQIDRYNEWSNDQQQVVNIAYLIKG